MALIDTYRNNIKRKREELAKLRQEKAKESAKIPQQYKRIIDAKNAISRTKSESTIKFKLREIEKAEKEIASINKKIADIEKKIGIKDKELTTEEQRYLTEEERVNKKKADLEKKRLQETTRQMLSIDRALQQHNYAQKRMQDEITLLKKIPEKITVLFMASNPLDTDYLRLDEEARSIQEMIRKSKHRDSVKFETRWAARPLDILQAINELNPDVVHFSGHGTQDGELILQNANGNKQFVSMEAIVQTMMTSSDKIRLVFFNTCFSYEQAISVVSEVEAAIGMTDSISDNAARIFAAQFYSSIGFGLSLKKAYDQAITALMLEGFLEEDKPKLYVKDNLNPDDIFLVCQK